MKLKLTYIITAGLIVLLLFSVQGCKKDPIKCLECDKCKDFPEPKDGIIGFIAQKSFQRKAPCFNPNNGSEFIYVKQEGNKKSLIKYNIDNKQENTLLENVNIIGQPKWGKNGWIVFSSSFDIHIIRENGDSLKRLTYFFENNHPSFLGENKIFFSVGVETSPGASGNKVIDYFGKRIDSLKTSNSNGLLSINSINNENEIAGMSSKKPGSDFVTIAYFTMEDRVFNHVYEFEYSGRKDIKGITWHPNNQDIYFSTYREGLYRVNKNTKEVLKIRNGCDSRSYRFLSISPDWKKIIVERVDATDFDNKSGSWTEESKIYIMNIDGEDEKNVFE